MPNKLQAIFPFEGDSPAWLSCLTFSREDKYIVIEAVRRSGTLLGEIRIDASRFGQIVNILLSENAEFPDPARFNRTGDNPEAPTKE